MRRMLRENGLSLTLFGLFLLTLSGQIVTGYFDYIEDRLEHRQRAISFAAYFTSGHFIEATMENWESEFLQMATFVVLTAFLYQKGSAESKRIDVIEPVDVDPRGSEQKREAPWPVRRGGWALKLYEHSLSIVFFMLFLISFILHALGGAWEYNREQLLHGKETISVISFLGTSRFWFESFQNWQSEFLSVGSMVVLTIFLRQKGSPESKPVESPYSETSV
jgi:hypothetical protein